MRMWALMLYPAFSVQIKNWESHIQMLTLDLYFYLRQAANLHAITKGIGATLWPTKRTKETTSEIRSFIDVLSSFLNSF